MELFVTELQKFLLAKCLHAPARSKGINICKGINTRNSCGHDLIPPRLLEESASLISGPLCDIMNHSIVEGRYPSQWKMGWITPLFKTWQHDKSKKEYYRPVTVLPALNNIFKRLLSLQMSKFYSSILSDFISAQFTALQIISRMAPVKLSDQTYFCSDISHLWLDKHRLRLVAIKVPPPPFTWC